MPGFIQSEPHIVASALQHLVPKPAIRRLLQASVVSVSTICSFVAPAATPRDESARATGQIPWESPTPVRFGEVAHPVLGSYYGSGADYGPDTVLMGNSIYQDSWPVAHMKNNAGKTYIVFLGHSRDGNASTFIWVNSTDGSGLVQPDPRMPAIPKRPVDYWYDPAKDAVRYTATGAAEAASVDITLNDKEMTYKLAGVVDLKGEAVTPSIFRYVPWRRGNLSGVQVSSGQEYPASGTIFGEQVTGFLHIDRNFDRVSWTEGPMRHVLHGYQSLWITMFADGSSEHGALWCGRTGMRGAIVVDNMGRELVNTNDMTVSVHWGKGQTITGADLKIAGVDWQYIATPNNIPLMQTVKADPRPAERSGLSGASFTNSLDGLMVRKGEKRKVVSYWANGEADPNRPCVAPAAPLHP